MASSDIRNLKYVFSLTVGMIAGMLSGLAAQFAYDPSNTIALIAVFVILLGGIVVFIAVSLGKFTSVYLSDFVGVGLGTGLITGIGSIAIYKAYWGIELVVAIIFIVLFLITIAYYLKLNSKVIQSLKCWFTNTTHISDNWYLFIVSLLLMVVFGILIANYAFFLPSLAVIYIAFTGFAASIIAFIFGLMQGIYGKAELAHAKRFIVALILIFVLSMGYFWAISTVNIGNSLKWMVDGSNAIISGVIGALAYDVIIHQDAKNVKKPQPKKRSSRRNPSQFRYARRFANKP
jgi:hypothetical protein